MPAVTALRSYSGAATVGGRDERVLLDNFISYYHCCLFLHKKPFKAGSELSRQCFARKSRSAIKRPPPDASPNRERVKSVKRPMKPFLVPSFQMMV